MKQRPINLNLFTIHFPLPAIVSFLHRVSGVVLCLMIPFFLWMLQQSLQSRERFDRLQQDLSSIGMKVLLVIMGAALLFHFIAGIRHLLMDIHVGDSLKGGRISAILVFIFFIAGLIVSGGVGLWWK